MKLGLILFIVGAVLAGINLRIMGDRAKRGPQESAKTSTQGWTPQLIIINVLMVLFVLLLLTGLIIVFTHKWWLALILLSVGTPFVISIVSGEKT